MIKGACVSRAYQIRKNSPIMHYWIRSEDGKKYHIQSYMDKPYFYALIDGNPKHRDIADISDEFYTTQFGEKVQKITTTVPKSIGGGYTYYDRDLQMRLHVDPITDLPELKKSFENYIEFVDRCAIDHGIKYGMWAKNVNVGLNDQIGGYETKVMPTIVTIDIEARTYRYNEREDTEKKTVPFPEIREARNEIISIQCLDNQTEEIYVFVLCQEFNEYKKVANLKKIKDVKFGRKTKKRIKIPFKMSDKATKLINGKSEFLIHLHEFYTERALLEFFVKFIQKKDYDIITAFNGMNFDYPYLIRRMGNLKVNFNKLSPLDYITCRIKGETYRNKYVEETNIKIPGRNLMDSMKLFKDKVFVKRSKNGLMAFSMDYLGVGKIHRGINPETRKEYSIEYSFFKQYKTFLMYACYDVILDFYLQKYLNIWKHFITLVKNSGCQITHVLQGRKRVRQTVLEYAKKPEFNMVVEPENYSASFQGADVFKPTKVGKVNNAADLDITSQYPSAIEANNISWDTLILDHNIFTIDAYPHFENVMDITTAEKLNIPYSKNPIEGVYFRMDKIGLFPQIIKDRKSLRNNVRHKLNTAVIYSEFLKVSELDELDIESFLKFIKEDEWIDILNNEHIFTDSIDIINNIRTIFMYNYENRFEELLEDFIKITDIDRLKYIIKQWDNDQAVLKVDINTIYGNLPPFLAACVTAIGRKLINFTRFIIKKLGYPAIYTDTDSVIFQTGIDDVDKSIEICEYLTDEINEGYVKLAKYYNWDPSPLSIKSEEIYNPIVFVYNKSSGYKSVAAKKYIKHLVADRGIKLTEPVLSHKGLIKRRDSSELSINIGYMLIYYIGMNYSNRDIIKRILKLKTQILKEGDSLDIDEEELIDIEKKLSRKIKSDKYNIEDIAFPLNLGKELSEYVNIDYARKAILKTNEYGNEWSTIHKKFEKGDSALIAFVKPNSIPDHLPIDERNTWALDYEGLLHPDFKINYLAHFDRALTKYDSLLKAVGIEPSILKRDPSQLRLFQ